MEAGAGDLKAVLSQTVRVIGDWGTVGAEGVIPAYARPIARQIVIQEPCEVRLNEASQAKLPIAIGRPDLEAVLADVNLGSGFAGGVCDFFLNFKLSFKQLDLGIERLVFRLGDRLS